VGVGLLLDLLSWGGSDHSSPPAEPGPFGKTWLKSGLIWTLQGDTKISFLAVLHVHPQLASGSDITNACMQHFLVKAQVLFI
jgi:hypothetical protein